MSSIEMVAFEALKEISLMKKLGLLAREAFYELQQNRIKQIGLYARQLRDEARRGTCQDSWGTIAVTKTTDGIVVTSERIIDDETSGSTTTWVSWTPEGRLHELLAVREYRSPNGAPLYMPNDEPMVGDYVLGRSANSMTEDELVTELGGARDRLVF